MTLAGKDDCILNRAIRLHDLSRRLPAALIVSLITVSVPGDRPAAVAWEQSQFDLVLRGGRVVDPASGLDAIRNVGITAGTIRAITEDSLVGSRSMDASGLVVAPGFIDLHSHGQDPENYAAKAMDGVTTALELEIGTSDVDAWYAQRNGKSLINYGVSVGHVPLRIDLMRDPGGFLPTGDAAHKPATADDVKLLKAGVEQGLKRGALAVGLGIAYTPAASHWEIAEIFRAAARYGAPCHVHMRYAGSKEPETSVAALQEVIADSAVSGAPLHVVHVSSMGLRETARLLQMITEARAHGIDVTTECYPYTAAMTSLGSALFDEGWQEKLGIGYHELQWVATGERLTASTFSRYRGSPGSVILHLIPEDVVVMAVASPLTMIASDGGLSGGKGHPRSSGSYARVLGRYVREKKTLPLIEALKKMTIMPAERLERRAPLFQRKGRIEIGADADITIFDPATVADRATYDKPAEYSTGIKYVLVGGTPVVFDGKLRLDAMPGRALRAPVE
jgi:N-acyl-D-aspartate/D-glutamate deacylase